MRHVTEVEMNRAILHLAAPNKRGLLTLSERELPLRPGRVHDFIHGHIEKALQDPSARAASFQVADATGGRISGWCHQALSGTAEEFIQSSRRIAQSMHDHMTQNRNISDAMLAIVAYTGTESNTVSRSQYLALCKLDPGEGFTPVQREDEEGRPYVDLEVEEDILPTTGERLQKAAFVRSDYDQRYQLLVVDLQGRGPEREPRQWFLQRFLEAETAFDPRELTAGFYKGVRKARDLLASDLGPERTKEFDLAINGALAGETLNVDTFLDAQGLEDEQRQLVVEQIDAQIPDREFRVDPDTRTQLLRTIAFRGDNDLQLRAPPAAFRNMVETSPDEADPDVTVVTIRTRSWRRVD